MKHTFKRAMSLFMALAMVLTMVPSFGTHVHAEELETEPVVMTEEPATEAPVVEAPETEAAETEAPTQAPETEAPATEAPVVETEAPEVTEEAPEVVETEPAEETEAIEESFPEEILEEEIIEEEAVAAIETHPLSTISGLYAEWTDAANSGGTAKGSASWSASGTGITGTATGYETTTMGVAVTTKLTLKNVSGGEAKLSFDYFLNDGSAIVADSDDNKVSIAKDTRGSYAKVLAADDAITITLTSAKAKPPRANELQITGMSLISTSAAPVTTTFVPAVEGGTYSVNGVEVTAETAEETAAGTKFTLTAVAGEGYVFFGWYDMSTNTCLDYNAEYAYTASKDGAEIVAKFVSASTALFGVGAAKFYSLTEAGAFAERGDTKLIVLLNDGVVTGSHSIPAGTTLLIPFDDKNTVYTDTPVCTNTDSQHAAEWVRPTAYRTLELAEGATISVSGSISISAKHFAGGSGRNAASPTENVGFVKMGSGSQITLNSGANLYAWGFVTGSGKVIAKSGAKVYENFQVRDFRGGGATSAMATDFIVFPMTQYYVQNIEVPVTFEYGAEEHVYTSLFMSGRAYSAGVKFIGDKAMFRPEEGCKLTKDYIESRDRLQLSVEGTASLASLTLSVEGVADIDSSVFLLPINSNITIEILSGTTTLCQDVSLLPGVELTVAQGAVLNVASGKGSATIESGTGSNVFVYDADEWNYGLVWDEEIEDLVQDNTVGYVYPNTKFVALDYVPGRTYTRTTADLKDVKLDINGTLVADGFLYTTAGGANITSSEKCGVVAMNSGAGEETFTYQAIQIDTIPVYCALPVASAQLRNGDGTYLDTTGAKPGATYNYCARGDHWFLGECADVHGVEITWVGADNADLGTEEYAIGAIPEYKGTPTKATANCKAYTFAGWKDQDGKEYPTGTALPAATVDATYFAYFTESDAHIDEDMDHLCDNCDTQISECEYGEPEYVWPSVDTCIAALMCKYCDEGIVNTVEATVSEIPATCMAKGSITYTATFAVGWAETQTKTVEVEKNPENHTKQNTYVEGAKEATCGAAGYTGDTYCECGEKIADGETIPATGEHNYATEVSRTAATCMAKGSVTNKCGCGAQITETLEIDPTNHTGKNHFENAVSETCGKDGYEGDIVCECGVKVGTGKTIPATGNHNYVTEVGRTAATCVAEGSVTKKCACGAQITETLEIDPTNHTGKNHFENAVPETCGKDGYEGDIVCECGVKVGTGKTIPATGNHNYVTEVSRTAATCMAEGSVTKKCGCGAQITETLEIDPTNHTKQNTTVKDAVEATCGAEGYTGDTYCECGEKIADGKTIPATGAHVDGDDENHDCDNCPATEVDGGCHGGEATCQGPAVCDECDSEYGDLDPENHASDAFTYENINWDGTHVKSHECCGVVIDEAEPCDYTTGEEEHTCACGQVEHFILTIEYLAIDEDGELCWETKKVSVPYGARLSEVEEVAGLASEIYVNASDNKGVFVLDGYAFGPSKDELTGGYVIEEETMPASDAWLSAEYIFTGWANYGEGWVYEIKNEIQMTGWKAFDDGEGGKDWYYLDPETGIRAEGIARVPYPSEPINGFTYGANEEDMANTDYNYPDATEAWFVFASGTENGENDGKFLNNYSGPANTDKALISWAVKGMIPWHVGMVQLDENVYAYFIGDEVNGGNVMATGDVYVIRVADNCERAFAIGGIYTFGENGLLIDNHGIVDMGNGTKRYYQNAQLMAGAGLIEVPIDNNDNHAFIFVRGNGELVVNTKYWVGANDLNVVPGLYAFDENGYMINPAPADKNGVFAEDGALYFYENGKRTYKGLIEYGDGIIYVTTSGKLATGKYYVTKTDLIEGYEPGFYFFDAEGYMEITTRNGIVDGKFYVNGEVQYGAGLIEYNDGMIYVKSNGQVVMDQAYWITNTNNLLPAGCYEFDSEGYLQIDESLDGVVGLNYYIDGVKQFGNGLVKVEDGYIYVKTNGELATGTYWITRTNGLMSAGCYEFDTDGYMILG